MRSFYDPHPGVSDKDHILSVMAENKHAIQIWNAVKIDPHTGQKIIADNPDLIRDFNKQQHMYHYDLVTMGYNLLQNDTKLRDKSPSELLSSEFPKMRFDHLRKEKIIDTTSEKIKEMQYQMFDNIDRVQMGFGCLPLIIGSPVGMAIGTMVNQVLAGAFIGGIIASAGSMYYLWQSGEKKNEKLKPKLTEMKENLEKQQSVPDFYQPTLTALRAMRHQKPELLVEKEVVHQAEYIIETLLNKPLKI